MAIVKVRLKAAFIWPCFKKCICILKKIEGQTEDLTFSVFSGKSLCRYARNLILLLDKTHKIICNGYIRDLVLFFQIWSRRGNVRDFTEWFRYDSQRLDGEATARNNAYFVLKLCTIFIENTTKLKLKLAKSTQVILIVQNSSNAINIM